MQKDKPATSRKNTKKTTKSPKRALGKGLGALIPDIETLSNQPMAANTTFTIKKERLSKKERSNSKAKERHDLWMRHSSSHTKRHQALQQNH